MVNGQRSIVNGQSVEGASVHSFVEVGEVVKVKILDIPEHKNQLKLSAKAVEDNNIHKINKKKIQETVFGFYLLKSSLPGWISKKMEEIEKKC